MVFWIWSLVLNCKCVGEVNQFSAWLGLVALILAFMIIVGIVFIVVFVGVFLFFGLTRAG